MAQTIPHHDAFPRTFYENDVPVDSTEGLTKREYFAAMAVSGLAAIPHLTNEEIAKHALRVADYLIAELNRSALDATATPDTPDEEKCSVAS